MALPNSYWPQNKNCWADNVMAREVSLLIRKVLYSGPKLISSGNNTNCVKFVGSGKLGKLSRLLSEPFVIIGVLHEEQRPPLRSGLSSRESSDNGVGPFKTYIALQSHFIVLITFQTIDQLGYLVI